MMVAGSLWAEYRYIHVSRVKPAPYPNKLSLCAYPASIPDMSKSGAGTNLVSPRILVGWTWLEKSWGAIFNQAKKVFPFTLPAIEPSRDLLSDEVAGLTQVTWGFLCGLVFPPWLKPSKPPL